MMGKQAPEYRINRDIFTPYAGAAGVLNGNTSTKYVVNQNLVVYMHHSFIIWGGAGTWSSDVTGNDVTRSCITGSCITGDDVTGNDVTGTENEREIISRAFFSPGFCRVFSKTSLDSMYGQWNCESNLYRVTIALLPPMLNHFSLLNCAVSRD